MNTSDSISAPKKQSATAIRREHPLFITIHITRREKLLRYMPRKKLEERNIRRLTRIAGVSLGLTLPIEIVRKFGWKERQKVKLEINNRNHSILIKRCKRKVRKKV